MHSWLRLEMGCSLYADGNQVICVQHLPGIRDLLRKESTEETVEQISKANSLSNTLRNCLDAGSKLDGNYIENLYGISKETLDLFMPIECPKKTITQDGILRSWNTSTNLTTKQATTLQRAIRRAFWKAVNEFSSNYAKKHSKEEYSPIDMIEAFCKATQTPDTYAESIRREWHRYTKREDSSH